MLDDTLSRLSRFSDDIDDLPCRQGKELDGRAVRAYNGVGAGAGAGTFAAGNGSTGYTHGPGAGTGAGAGAGGLPLL